MSCPVMSEFLPKAASVISKQSGLLLDPWQSYLGKPLCYISPCICIRVESSITLKIYVTLELIAVSVGSTFS